MADEKGRPALAELSLLRLREFLREPEAVFWTFIFPLLLAAGLGIAFRNRPAETVRIGVVATSPAAAESTAAALRTSDQLSVELFPNDSVAARSLHSGSVALVVARDAAGAVEYRFDAQRPEARTARLLANETMQRTAGRSDPVSVSDAAVTARGSRYIDFLIPGLLGLNIMGGGIWSTAFSIVTARNKKLLKRL